MNFFAGQAGGGSPAASWKPRGIGDGFRGKIETVSYVDKTVYGTNPPLKEVGPDGQPVKQLRIVVQGEQDGYATASKPLIDETTKQQIPDDGRRAIYIARDTNLSFAVARVLKELGLEDADPLVTLPGGDFAVQWVGEIPSGKGNPTKDHMVWITPAPPKDPNGFMAGQVQQPQGFAPQAAPQQQGFPQPAAPAPQVQQQGFAPQVPQQQQQQQQQYQQQVQQPQQQYQQQVPQQGFAPQAQAQQPQGFAPQAAPQQQVQQPQQAQGFAQQPAAAPQSNLPAFQQQAATQGFAPQGAPQAAPSGFTDEPPF